MFIMIHRWMFEVARQQSAADSWLVVLVSVHVCAVMSIMLRIVATWITVVARFVNCVLLGSCALSSIMYDVVVLELCKGAF